MRRMRGVSPRQKSSAISGSFAPLYAAKKKKKRKSQFFGEKMLREKMEEEEEEEEENRRNCNKMAAINNTAKNCIKFALDVFLLKS